jgi:hypothetical protein
MLNVAAVQDALNKTFMEPLQDLIPRSNPMLNAITKRGVAGDKIRVKVKLSSEHSAGPIADGTAVTLSGDETTNYAGGELAWSTYVDKFSVPSRLVASLSDQPGSLGAIFESEIMEAAKDLAGRIGGDLWKGVTANGLVGIQSAIANGNTYMGFDRSQSAYERLRSIVVSHAAAELSTSALYALDDAYFGANYYGFREQPGLFTGFCTPEVLTKYSKLFTNIDLASLSTAHFVNQANATGNLGNSSVGFLGVPFQRAHQISVTGDTANTGRLYLMNMSQLFLATLDPKGDASAHAAQGAQSAPTVDGIKAEVVILPVDGERIQGYVRTYIQLVVPNPREAGMVLTNIKTN